MKTKRMLVGLFVIFTGFWGFYPNAVWAQKVVVGGAVPLTGPSANDGQMARDGAALALEHSKTRPELQKYSIEFLCEDDRSDPKEAAAIANKFAGDDKTYALIGDYNSSCTLAGAPIFDQRRYYSDFTGLQLPQNYRIQQILVPDSAYG